MKSCSLSSALATAVALAAAIAAFSTSGCSGPNPAAVKYEERDPENPAPSNNNNNNNNNNTTDAGGTPDPGTATDGGGTTSPSPVQDSAVFGSSTFGYQAPTKVANDVPNHGGSVSGKDCIVMGCHLDNSHKWGFAGTLFTSTAGTTPVTKGEVRIVGPQGQLIGNAFTDSGGNFWLETTATVIPPGAKVGVRTATDEAYMIMGLQTTDKGCNANRANCHGTSATGKIHVP